MFNICTPHMKSECKYEEWGRHLVKGFSGSGWSKVQMQHDPTGHGIVSLDKV